MVPSFTTFSAGIGWGHPDSRLSIRAYVNNVFNVTYWTFSPRMNPGGGRRWDSVELEKG